MKSIKHFLVFLYAGSAIIFLLNSCQQPCAIPQFAGQELDTINREQVSVLQRNLNNWLSSCEKDCGEISENNNVWFSIESLTDYLSYAQHVSAQNATTIPEISGIRLYFGKNTNNELTVVVSATYKSPGAASATPNDKDLGFGVLNYGHAGMPPKKTYPH